MKKTISVPQLDDNHTDASYSVVTDYAAAIDAGAEKLGAVKVGRSYYYRADEADEVFRLSPREVAEYGAGVLDDRGVDYSLWCSTTGEMVKRPSRVVREELGIEEPGAAAE